MCIRDRGILYGSLFRSACGFNPFQHQARLSLFLVVVLFRLFQEGFLHEALLFLRDGRRLGHRFLRGRGRGGGGRFLLLGGLGGFFCLGGLIGLVLLALLPLGLGGLLFLRQALLLLLGLLGQVIGVLVGEGGVAFRVIQPCLLYTSRCV